MFCGDFNDNSMLKGGANVQDVAVGRIVLISIPNSSNISRQFVSFNCISYISYISYICFTVHLSTLHLHVSIHPISHPLFVSHRLFDKFPSLRQDVDLYWKTMLVISTYHYKLNNRRFIQSKFEDLTFDQVR